MAENRVQSWNLFSWPRVGVVDVGSNAIRVTIAEIRHDKIEELANHRFALRLGKDVFNRGRTLSSATQTNLVEIFIEIKKIFSTHKVDLYRVVATSALRSARNRKQVLANVLKATGIRIELISALEEGRLIGASLPQKPYARSELLMDLGGGSLELAYYEKGNLQGVTTLPLGAVRLLGIFEKQSLTPDALCRHIASICQRDRFLKKFLKHPPKKLFIVGSGGNIRALYRLRKKILQKKCSRQPVLNLKDLAALTQKLEILSPKQREKKFKMAKDRADIILPAAYVFHEILHYLGSDIIHIPMSVSLRRGTLVDLQKNFF